MMGLEIMPDNLDVVELGCVFWEPLDGEPMLAGVERCQRELAGVDRAVVLDQHDRHHGSSRFGGIPAVKLLEVSDEVAAALGRARVHDEPAGEVVERADHRHFLGLARRRHPQIGTTLGPGPRQIGMRQRLALVAIEQNDVAGLGLGLAQLKAQSHALDLVGDLAAFQRVAGPPPAEVFFRKTLDSCDRLIVMPAWPAISALRRAIVQLRRSATGASSNGVTTPSAASLFTGGGPGATVAFNAAMPPPMKSLRQRRTVSSRTPKGRGESGPPCGVPSTLGLTSPFSITPALRNARMSFSSRLSSIRLATWPISLS